MAVLVLALTLFRFGERHGNRQLKITIPENLDLTCGDYGVKLLPENQILMEVKIPGAAPVWLSHILSELNIFPISFSKYGKCYQKMMERNKEIIMGVDNCA